MRRYGYTMQESRLDLFDTWLELKTSPCFQMHRLTDAACKILDRTDYGRRGLHTRCVKAVQVSTVMTRDDRPVTEVLCISIKFPVAPEILTPRGLLVLATDDAPAAQVRVPGPVQLGLFGEGPEAEVVFEPDGLRMTGRNRVMSITPWRVRLFGTGRIGDTYGWGARDKRNPPMAPLTPEILASLDSLLP